MKTRTFTNGLVVKHRKSAIIFENEAGKREGQELFKYPFSPSEFDDFVSYIETIANEAWTNVTPKDATSAGSDYWEYYDRKYENNGYLHVKDDGIQVTAPHNSIDTLYQFNKPKIQSFIYDCRKKLTA